MTTKQKEPALPQLKKMLGRAAADRIVREGEGARHSRRGRSHRWGWQGRARVRLVATFAVVTVAAAAVGAGAFDRAPVAPQLGPAESGVKPGVVPGELEILQGPDSEKVQGGVSPCIKSDPSGYSGAELADPEWCFHKPGEGSGGPRSGVPAPGSSTGKQEPRGRVYHLTPEGQASP
jgi:hypothetical protein